MSLNFKGIMYPKVQFLMPNKNITEILPNNKLVYATTHSVVLNKSPEWRLLNNTCLFFLLFFLGRLQWCHYFL